MPEETILETDHWKTILIDNQSELGRCKIALKRKETSMSGITEDEWLDFSNTVKTIEKAIRKAFNATMFNWSCLMNNAYKKNPPDPQIHWHLRPRYNHDVEFAGNTFRDENFASHYDWKKEKIIDKDTLKKIADKIRKNI